MRTPNWFLKRNFIAIALLPFSIIYWLVSKLVFISRLFRQKTSKRPARLRTAMARQVICIGNIMAGGVGKTPIVAEIAKYLKSPVVMRGYKGGDEAKMLQKAGIDVYVGDRVKNITKLNQKSEIINHKLPIIMDDGFQNPTIKKDISILVFDGKIGVGNGFLLPAGPLRETMCSGIKRADAVIIIGEQSLSTKIKKINSKIPIFYAGTETAKPVGAPRIFAFAGIGYPGKFFDALRTIRGIKGFMSRTFPDHHQYSERELIDMKKTADAQNMKLVTTAKDHVRLSPKWQKLVLVAPLTITIEPAFFKWLKEKVK